jgi:tol-pal system protein YbgF
MRETFMYPHKKLFFSVAVSATVAMMSLGVQQACAQDNPYADQIEQQEMDLRRLTGEVETLKYKMMRLEKKLESLSKDTDFRFKELEEKPKKSGDESSDYSDKKKADTDTSASAGVTEDSSRSAQTVYQTALSQLQRKNFKNAETGFMRFIDRYPKNSLLSNAYYWLGESRYAQKQYDAAAMAFLDGSRKYPKSVKAGHSLLKLGMSLNKLDEKKEACSTFDEVEEVYLPKDDTLRNLIERERLNTGC